MHSHLWRARTAAVLVAVAAVAGCADSEPTTDEPPAEPQTTASTPPAAGDSDATDTSEDESAAEDSDADVEVIEVAITDGQAQTERSRVDVTVGTMVRIEVRADVDEEVHVHGYDLSAPVTPAEAAVLEFSADIPGVFEVEAEHSGLELFQLRVR